MDAKYGETILPFQFQLQSIKEHRTKVQQE